MKRTLEELITEVENVIKGKWNTSNQQSVDEEILAIISVYRHGSEEYKKIAQKWLIDFFVHTQFVNKRKDIKI